MSPERAAGQGEKPFRKIGYQSTLPESRCWPTSLIDVVCVEWQEAPIDYDVPSTAEIANDLDTLTARCMSLINTRPSHLISCNLVVCSPN